MTWEETIKLLEKGWQKEAKENRKRLKRGPEIYVGKKQWDEIKADPTHFLHETQKRSMRRYRREKPWKDLVSWFRRITGIERRHNERLRKRYNFWVPPYHTPTSPLPKDLE